MPTRHPAMLCGLMLTLPSLTLRTNHSTLASYRCMSSSVRHRTLTQLWTDGFQYVKDLGGLVPEIGLKPPFGSELERKPLIVEESCSLHQ